MLKCLFIFFLSLTLLFSPSVTAAPETPFLEERLATASGSERFDVLNRLIAAYFSGNPEKALEYSRESLRLAQKLEDSSRIISALLNCGRSYKNLQLPQLASEYLFHALAQSRTAGDQFQEGIVLSAIGNFYFETAKYDQAAQYFLQSLEIRTAIDDQVGASKCLNNLGRVYDKLQQFEQAINYFHQALERKKLAFDPSGTVFTLNNLGLSYRSNGNRILALKCFQDALILAENRQSPIELGYTHNNLGEIIADTNDHESALAHFTAAQDYYNRAHYSKGEAFALLNISKSRQALGELSAAIEYARNALTLAQQRQQIELQKSICLQLSYLYEQTGEPQQALQYLRQHTQIREKLLSETIHERIISLQLDYEQKSKAREIELLRKEAQLQSLELGRRQQIIYSIAALLLMCCAIVYGMKKRAQAREIREKELVAIKIKLEESNRSLHALSETDPLTGLANRRRFDKTLYWESLSAQENELDLSLIMVDVDHFKLYNDSYGHHQGDICLQRISHCLRRTLQGDTVLVARYGGEEFAAILLNTDLKKAQELAEKARQAIAALNITHEKAPGHGKVTASFGVASLRASDNQPHNLVRSADDSLYRAKDLGRNQVFANPVSVPVQ